MFRRLEIVYTYVIVERMCFLRSFNQLSDKGGEDRFLFF